MTYRAPVADIAFALKNAAGFGPALAEGLYGDLGEDVVEAVLEEAGKFATDILAPLNTVGDRQGATFKDGAVTTAAGLEGGLSRLVGGRLERARGAREMGRPGAAARHQRRLHRDVELGRHGLRPRPAAHHGGRRRAGGTWLGRAQARLSAEAHLGRMDGHDAAHGAAGRLRRRRAAHPRRARRRRQLPHHRAENLHHLWRARPHRQHHSFRAGAAARRAAGNAGHLALPGAEIPAQRRRLARRAQRRARPVDRAQARHSCLPHLHHGLWRRRRRHRLPHRRGEPRHGLHVHHDEPGAALGRAAGRRHRRARDATGTGLCARAQAGPR